MKILIATNHENFKCRNEMFLKECNLQMLIACFDF